MGLGAGESVGAAALLAAVIGWGLARIHFTWNAEFGFAAGSDSFVLF